MGLLDKVKAQAEQVAQKAQQGVSQGQAKLDAMQAKKQGDALLRDLGAAYYAQQRSGGPETAVTEAFSRVEAHIAEHGAPDAPSASAEPTMPQQSTSPEDGASYKLDDM